MNQLDQSTVSLKQSLNTQNSELYLECLLYLCRLMRINKDITKQKKSRREPDVVVPAEVTALFDSVDPRDFNFYIKQV